MLFTLRWSRKMLTKNSQRETYLFSLTTGIWLFLQYYATIDSQTLFVHLSLRGEKGIWLFLPSTKQVPCVLLLPGIAQPPLPPA